MLATSAVGLWACVLSLRSDLFGLGLTRTRIAVLIPLFVLLALVAALHFFQEDVAAGLNLSTANP
jgi:hypothetical protein